MTDHELDRHWLELEHLCRVTAPKYAYTASDVDELADVLRLHLLVALRDYDPARGSTMKTWCVTRLRWRATEWRREEAKAREVRERAGYVTALEWGTKLGDGAGMRTLADAVPDDRPGPEAEVVAERTETPISAERLRVVTRVRAYLDSLPAATRHALVARYVEGASVREVMDEARLSSYQVYHYTRQARKALADLA